MTPIRLLLLVIALLAAVAARRAVPARAPMPPIVFVARDPLPDGGIPGFGPMHRTAVTEGRLMVLRPDGSVRPLIDDGIFIDVSGPDVSWDGRKIAFAATPAADSPWRIYVVNADGTGLKAATRTDREIDLALLGTTAARFVVYDDFDPCWMPDGRIAFASTRYPLLSQEGDFIASNLFVVDPATDHTSRITTERNGAEEPTIDLETGRVVYARWWFNRFLASERESIGVTLDTALAVPSDRVDLWHAISTTPAGDGNRLAGGNPRVRAETMAYQPLVLRDGTLIGVRAEHLSMVPSPGRLTLQIFPRRFAEPRFLAVDSVSSSCSPALLPDGRILFSHDPTGEGDFGLWTASLDGKKIVKLFDLPGKQDLDAVPMAPRRKPPVIAEMLGDFPRVTPVLDERFLRDSITTFRFDCLNVFTNAPVDAPFPDAPPLQKGLRIRFYAALSRPSSQGGDSVLLLRQTDVDPSGAVHEHELPADTPMFEQLVDAHGRVLRSVTGPAHVPGFNSGRFGHGTQCVGCHIGHSAIPVALSAHEGKRFNASPSAEIAVSSVAEGTAGGGAVADRRAMGPPERVAWVSSGTEGEYLRLTWKWPIEVDSLVIYAIKPQLAQGTDLKVQELQLTFLQGGREVRRETLQREIVPAGTRLACQGLRVDAIELRPTRFTGRVHHRAAVGIAEVETLARLTED
jgi:hypothetical protein